MLKIKNFKPPPPTTKNIVLASKFSLIKKVKRNTEKAIEFPGGKLRAQKCYFHMVIPI